jgi:mRNA-degrading endonuclease toxin of MazEF toxin-antitoxin module
VVEEPRRGEVWWAAVDKRRPVVVVQADFLNRSAMAWILAVPLTSRLQHESFPGNVRLSRRETGLPRACVANVAMVAPLHRSAFIERAGRLPPGRLEQVAAGLGLILGLDR